MWLLILRMRCGDRQMNTNGGTSKSDWFILRSCPYIILCVGLSVSHLLVDQYVLYLLVRSCFYYICLSVLYLLVRLSVCLSVCYICWSVCIVFVFLSVYQCVIFGGLSVCREHLECTGCHCMYEQEMYSAVVVKPGIAVADAGLEDLEIDVLVFNGCCKCVNDGS